MALSCNSLPEYLSLLYYYFVRILPCADKVVLVSESGSP